MAVRILRITVLTTLFKWLILASKIILIKYLSHFDQFLSYKTDNNVNYRYDYENCDVYPINTLSRPNVGAMLAHRLRRWPNIVPTLVYCISG